MSSNEKLCVLGHPVSHSKSPVMYNAVYGRLGLPWHYDFMDVPAEEDAIAFLAKRDFLSINITTPYKPHAFAAATVRDVAARLAKGANVLVNAGDDLVAYNTDGQGCVAYLKRAGVAFEDAHVVVCGTGPTSLSIMHAAAAAGAAQVVLLGRNALRAQAVLDEYRALLESVLIDSSAQQPLRGSAESAGILHCDFLASDYGQAAGAIATADVVVDATPLGMNEGDPAPFDTALLHEGQTAFDVVYGHGETAFAAGARAAGCRVLTGGGMLVGQAVVTAQIVLDAAGVQHGLSSDDLFSIMADAAGFEL